MLCSIHYITPHRLVEKFIFPLCLLNTSSLNTIWNNENLIYSVLKIYACSEPACNEFLHLVWLISAPKSSFSWTRAEDVRKTISPPGQFILRAQEYLLCPQEGRACHAAEHVQHRFLLCKWFLLFGDLSSKSVTSIDGNLSAITMAHLPFGEAEANSCFLLDHEEINKVIKEATERQRAGDDVPGLIILFKAAL